MKFRAGTPLLIGVLADVSGSMRSSIGSSGAAAMNRLEAFSEALEHLVKQAAASVGELSHDAAPTEVRLFAYGFGFGGLLSGLLGRGGPRVRDLLAPGGQGERTVDVSRLAKDWRAHQANVRAMALEMFGDTPMKEAFGLARARIAAETAGRPDASVLFVLSDGEPTDTDGDDTSILPIVEDIRRAGTVVVSCFVTDADITEPKRLYGEHQDGWPGAAKLMFDYASELPRGTSFDAHLREHGWRIDAGARLPAQVNQSEMLTEFLNVVLSPLRSGEARDGRGDGDADRGPLRAVDAASLPASASTVQASAAPAPGLKFGKTLILFLHGLGGRGEATRGRFPAFLMAEPEMAERFAVGFYSFPTSLFRLPFSARSPKIQELAAGLRTQIDHEEFGDVALVCHSLGGLIARRYLIEEVKSGRALRVKRLALFAVPNNGAGLASVGQFVSWRHNQIKQLCRDADIIEFLNEDWFRFGVQNKVKTKFIVGTQDEVADRFSVAGYWGNPDVETIVGRGHIDIVKPERADDLAVRILRRFLLS